MLPRRAARPGGSPATRHGGIAANIAKLPDLLGRRVRAAVRQATAHDDGRGDDDAAGIHHDSVLPHFKGTPTGPLAVPKKEPRP